MTPKPFSWASIFVMGFLISITAIADINGSVTLQPNTLFNFDSGTTGNSGDILWTGTSVIAQNGETVCTAYDGFPATQVRYYSCFTTMFPASQLSSVPAFFILTAARNPAYFQATAINGTTLTIQFRTYGVGANVTQIQNNYSYALPLYPNYGIAPGSLFIIKGTGLTDAAPPVLQSTAAPGLPFNLNGASISVTVNNVTVQPAIYYATPTQIAAVLPANTPVGTGTLVVLYKEFTTTPASFVVTASALGLDSYYGTGIGPAVATDPSTGALFTPVNSAFPGQTIVLWGSGLGADPSVSDTTFTIPSKSLNVPLQIYIGGVPAVIGYQGSSGYPGVNQINITIPESVPQGCAVSIAGIIGTNVTNTVTIPIAAGGGECNDPLFGLSGSIWMKLRTQATSTSGLIVVNSQGARADFGATTGANYDQLSSSVGSCYINAALPATSNYTGLNVGIIQISNSIGSFPFTNTTTGNYTFALPNTFYPDGTAFTLQGSGSASIGSFSISRSLPSPGLNWTNMSDAANVDRTQPFTVTWSGGSPGSLVQIFGTSQLSGKPVTSGYACYAPVEAGQFTVPTYILQGLPPGPFGSVQVMNISPAQTFSVPGLDFARAYGTDAYSKQTIYK